MSSILIENVLVGALGLTSVRVAEDLISEVGRQLSASSTDTVVDCGGAALFPGFVDVHCHGAVGVDVNEADVDGLLEIAGFLARNGVTAWVPTIVPDSDENYRQIIAATDRLM
jgi:N-acetylglucosamine-6-phosphate deacetylase